METLYVNRDARITREDATLVLKTAEGKQRWSPKSGQ